MTKMFTHGPYTSHARFIHASQHGAAHAALDVRSRCTPPPPPPQVSYAKLVCDAATGLSKGTAFVKYTRAADAQKALEAAKTATGVLISGQQLVVDIAVTRGDAAKASAARKEEAKVRVQCIYTHTCTYPNHTHTHTHIGTHTQGV